MSYSVEVTTLFRKQIKRLTKKHPSLKSEFAAFIESIKADPSQGISLGNHCYKIRIAISSKGKGKSGGARIITHIHVSESKVFLLSIYDKSEQADITESELERWLQALPDKYK